jgi:immunity protein 51 of polymorphic toxin system
LPPAADEDAVVPSDKRGDQLTTVIAVIGRKATDMMGTVPHHMNILDVAGSSSLTFKCGELPADAGVLAAGHEPNGYFWEGVVQYLTGDLASQVELGCEAGMFCARGDRSVLDQLREGLEGYIENPERIARLIREAEASGFQFDD